MKAIALFATAAAAVALLLSNGTASAQSVALSDARVQVPDLRGPERGSLAGALAGVAFGPGDVGRGVHSLPGPFAAPEERGPLLASPFPSYSPDQGLTEWGAGWSAPLAITRSRVSGELDYATDERSGPWGRMIRGTDGAWYPVGLHTHVRVEEAAADTLVAYLPDGQRWTFGGAARVISARGTYAWHLTAAEAMTGQRTDVAYATNASGGLFVSRVTYGGLAGSPQYAIELAYETLAQPFADYRSGSLSLLDRRVRRVTVQTKNAKTGAFAERWHHDLTYAKDKVGPAFYLTRVARVFASGEAPPPTVYTYRLPSSTWADSPPRQASKLDTLLAEGEWDVVQPYRSTQTDLDEDGRPDLERAADFRAYVQTDNGIAVEDLPPAAAGSDPLCRPAPLTDNDPRFLAKLRPSDPALSVVVLQQDAFGTRAAMTVCDRAGASLHRGTVVGDWNLTRNAKLVDINRDHLPDLVRVYAGGFEVIPNTSTTTSYSFGAPHSGLLLPVFEPTGTWAQDINGDGIVDLAARAGDALAVWFGLGNLQFETNARSFYFFDRGVQVASIVTAA